MTGTRPVQKIALIGGDGKDLIDAAMACGADTLVTGSAGYNAVLDASENGLNILEAGHYYTEAPVLAHLADICRKNEIPDCLFFDSNETKYWAAAEEISCK